MTHPKTLGIAFIAFLLVLLIFGIGLNMGAAKQPYVPLSPAAQMTYESAAQTLCTAEKTLAQSKLMDYLNNALKFDANTVKRLAEKRDLNCFQKPTAKAQTVEIPVVILKELDAQPEVQVDLNKLAYAVAQAETSNCTEGVGKTKNNCFGIRRKGAFVSYGSPEESYEDFKNVWSRYYGGLPTIAKARKYTANDKPETWLKIVNHYYYK